MVCKCHHLYHFISDPLPTFFPAADLVDYLATHTKVCAGSWIKRGSKIGYFMGSKMKKAVENQQLNSEFWRER